MPATTQIAVLDEDHVLRVVRYALSGPGEITEPSIRAFFEPEELAPAAVYALGQGLHAGDGIEVVGPAAARNTGGGTNARILIFRRGIISREFIAASPNLKFVQRLGVRADGIDLAAAAAHGVRVSCLPRPSLIYTAEHTILLMLALAKRLLVADAGVRGGRWDQARVRPVDGVAYNWTGLTGLTGLYGKTLGIIGLGEVGALLVPMARGMGMSVIYANRRQLPAEQEARLGVRYRPLEQLLGEADFVSVNAANLPENRGMIGAAAFAAMRPGAFVINTSRGKLVDEAALHAALASQRIAGAGLDVHWEEPRPVPDLLSGLDNVVLTPHCAGGNRIAIVHEVQEICDNCRRVLSGQPPLHEVA